jgi:heat shock protein HslJ
MKKSIIIGILLSVILMSCSKTNSTWSGTYNGTVSGSANINRVVLTQTGNNLQMLLQIESSGTYYTFVTIQNATISGNIATINEDGLIYGQTATYHFTGSAQLSGNNLVVNGSGTNTTNSTDVRQYYFSGSK